MDQITGYFASVGGYLGVGGSMVVVGIALLVAARKAPEENRRMLRIIGWPLLGCGGCLVVIPIIVIAALIALGLMMLTCGTAGC